MADRTMNQPASEFEEKMIQISRVSKKTKGGNKMGFSVLMVVGDKKGKVGVGLGKAKDVQSAVRKGVKKAKKHMIQVPLDGTTIPFSIKVKKGAGYVMLKPAPRGSGVIAGGPIRAVVEAAGVRDISSKILGTENQASNVYATFEALSKIQQIVALKGIKLKSIAEVEAEEQEKVQKLQEAAKQAALEKDKAEKAEAAKQKEATVKTAKPAKPAAKKPTEVVAKQPEVKPPVKKPVKKQPVKKAAKKE
jgi:small subunit ribosomal protein S5